MRKLLFYSLLLLLWQSCSNEDAEYLNSESNPENSFFEHTQSDDPFKEFVIDYLKTVNDSTSFANEFVNVFGVPQWDICESYGVKNASTLIVPILDVDQQAISSLYFFICENNQLDYYLLMNDVDDISYETSKHIIQYFELKLSLPQSNADFNSKLKGDNTKASRTTMEECWHYFSGTKDDPYMYYQGSRCTTSVSEDFVSDRGEWTTNLSGGGSVPNNPTPANGGNDGDGDDSNPEPNPEPAPPVEEDNSWTDTKADCVKEKLESGGSNSILNKLLNGFNLDKSTINLTFYVGNIDYRGNTVPNGKCIFDPNTKRMSIYISENRLNDSSLEIARTILHECFHAYIYGKLYESRIHKGLAPEPNFKRDFEEYDKKYGDQSQHNYMADKYRKYMKEGLETYFEADPKYSRLMGFFSDDPNWHGVDYLYESLTWGGLKNTDAWSEYSKNPENLKKYNSQKDFIYDYLPKENCQQ